MFRPCLACSVGVSDCLVADMVMTSKKGHFRRVDVCSCVCQAAFNKPELQMNPDFMRLGCACCLEFIPIAFHIKLCAQVRVEHPAPADA